MQVPKEESEQDFDTKYFGAYKNLNKSKEAETLEDKSPEDTQKHDQATSVTINEPSGIDSNEKTDSFSRQRSQGIGRRSTVQIEIRTEEEKNSISNKEEGEGETSQVFLQPTEHMRESVR